MQIIIDNFRDETTHPYPKSKVPYIEVLSYQCSPLSTSESIENTFARAKKYQDAANADSSLVVVVLLDEIGLAEHSPHLPLKVLHKLLEHPGTQKLKR